MSVVPDLIAKWKYQQPVVTVLLCILQLHPSYCSLRAFKGVMAYQGALNLSLLVIFCFLGTAGVVGLKGVRLLESYPTVILPRTLWILPSPESALEKQCGTHTRILRTVGIKIRS